MSNYLVIGASSGIGQQLALQLANSGHRVYATYFKNRLSSEQENLYYHYLNVMDEELKLDFLPEAVSGLIYCPGSINLRPFERTKADDFAADYQLQVVGAVKTIQAVLPRLRKSGHAAIVLFSTVAVQTGLSFHAQVSASKGALEGLTRALAAELAPAIRVNCIAPSLTDTPLAASLLSSEQKREANAQRHPLKRIGTAEDIAGIAEFLISETAGWITGQILHVDGGFSSIRT
jgi:NAD(P)-dependent dehydrogenase (short-subunit alcohol dehydrogenase family)